MVLDIKYNYCDITKYYIGSYTHNGITLEFQVIQIVKLDMSNTELLELEVVLNTNDYRRLNVEDVNTIKDNIRTEFNKKFS